VKRREPRAGGKRGTLAGLPPNLPPLLMAYRLQERAAGIGFDWPDAKGPMEKVKEEIGELENEQGAGAGSRSKKSSGICFRDRQPGAQTRHRGRSGAGARQSEIPTAIREAGKLAEERGLEMGRASLEELMDCGTR